MTMRHASIRSSAHARSVSSTTIRQFRWTEACQRRMHSRAAVRPLPNRRHWHIRCLAPSPEGQWRRHAARPARRWGQYAGEAEVERSRAVCVKGALKFGRTLRCARDPWPADGLVPPGSSRPRRQPLVRAAPGSTRESCCRTSRLSTPRARGPVLAAGARTRHVRDECKRNVNLTRRTRARPGRPRDRGPRSWRWSPRTPRSARCRAPRRHRPGGRRSTAAPHDDSPWG